MKRLVFFASGSGSNFQAVIDDVESGAINASIAGLISNKKNIQALERAHKHNIPTEVLAQSEFENSQKYETRLLHVLSEWNPSLIVLAGYLLKIPDSVVGKYEGKVINIHPALLPEYGGKGFYGLNVHRAVLNDEKKQSGCSVHLVTSNYDEGPVLAQHKVPVYENDTPEKLAKRVLEQEHQLLPEVIRNLVDDVDHYK